MLETREPQVTYIPFAHIQREERTYQFRSTAPERNTALIHSLTKSGQLHPVIIEEIEAERFVVLDGHRRVDAMARIQESGGIWEKIMAQVISNGALSTVDRFRIIRDKNVGGENAFGLHEKGCFFKSFLIFGMSLAELAAETGLTAHQVEDHVELAEAHATLVPLLNTTKLDVLFAVMLYRRYQGWLESPYAHVAPIIAKKCLDHAQHEKITMKSWRFLLDFYWGKEAPFMTSRRV